MIKLPDYCECCGAYLQGFATQHGPDCPIEKLIREHFPNIRETHAKNESTEDAQS